jgi:hypothetical protein
MEEFSMILGTAKNNMNWSDFDGHQVKVADAPAPDFQEAWLNGKTGYVDA